VTTAIRSISVYYSAHAMPAQFKRCMQGVTDLLTMEYIRFELLQRAAGSSTSQEDVTYASYTGIRLRSSHGNCKDISRLV